MTILPDAIAAQSAASSSAPEGTSRLTIGSPIPEESNSKTDDGTLRRMDSQSILSDVKLSVYANPLRSPSEWAIICPSNVTPVNRIHRMISTQGQAQTQIHFNPSHDQISFRPLRRGSSLCLFQETNDSIHMRLDLGIVGNSIYRVHVSDQPQHMR